VLDRQDHDHVASRKSKQHRAVAVARAQAVQPPHRSRVGVQPVQEVDDPRPANDDAAGEQRHDHVREDARRVATGGPRNRLAGGLGCLRHRRSS
jgi:hypothetical protein